MVEHNNFLIGTFTDADAEIAQLRKDAYLIDGSNALTAPFTAGAQTLFDVADVLLNHQVTGQTPIAGKLAVYTKADDLLYIKNSGGVESVLSVGGGGDVSAGSNFGTDNLLIRSDGVLKGVQASGITIDDDDNITNVKRISLTDPANFETTTYGHDNLGGLESTFIGFEAGQNNTAVANVGIGLRAGQCPGGGAQNNVCVGNLTLSSSTAGGENTAMGNFALKEVTTGFNNTGIGYTAGENITTGAQNTVIGMNSLKGVTTQNSNTVLGYGASTISTGGSNTVIGTNCMAISTGGSDNVAIGIAALRNCKNNQNIAIGTDCLIGYAATSPSSGENIAIGHQALNSITTVGSSNIAIGHTAGTSLTSGSNNIFISNSGLSTDSNTIRIGNASDHNNKTYIAGAFFTVPALSSTEIQDISTDSAGQLGAASITSSSTGLINGGVLSVNGGDNTLFDITDGFGFIFNSDTIVKQRISWTGLTGESSGVHVGNITNVAINNSATPVFFPGDLTNEEKRDNIFLGTLVHTGASAAFLFVGNNPLQIHSPVNQISDLAFAIGKIKESGMLIGSNNLLTIFSSSGVMYNFNGNYSTNRKDPSFIDIAAVDTDSAGTYAQILQNDAVVISLINIDSDLYDLSGVLTSVPSNDFQNMRLFQTGNSTLVVSPGQVIHNNLSTALSSILTESFITAPNMVENGLLIGYLTIRQNTSDLSNAALAVFTQAGKFGSTSGSSGGGDVSGAASSTDNAITRFDGITGKVLQNSLVTINDSGEISTPHSITINTVDALNNTRYGHFCLNNVTTGDFNTAFGGNALNSLSAGGFNTAFGYNAFQNISGSAFSRRNTGVGYASGSALTTGAENTFIGYQAGQAAITSVDNTAIGSQAMQTAASGSANTAIGASAHKNGTGGLNVSIGANSMQGAGAAQECVAVGNNSQEGNNLGSRSVSVGFQSLSAGAYDAVDNTTIGDKTGILLTTGINNCLFGSGSGNLLTTGANNIFIGEGSGNTITTTGSNIIIGNVGVVADTTTIRIGTEGVHTKCNIAGVKDAILSGVVKAVVIDSSGVIGATAVNSTLPLPTNFIEDLIVSDAGLQTKNISSGECRDSTNSFNITYAGGTVDISTSGAGGLDTGSSSSNTWYYIHIISNNDSSTVDTLVSLSATAPTLPGSFTIFRMILPVRKNSSNNFLSFHLMGRSRDRWVFYEEVDSTLRVLTAGSAIVYTNVSCASLVDPLSNFIEFNLVHQCTGANDFAVLFNGLTGTNTASNPRVIKAYGGSSSSQGTGNTIGRIFINSSQVINYGNSSAGESTDMYIIGFLVEL